MASLWLILATLCAQASLVLLIGHWPIPRFLGASFAVSAVIFLVAAIIKAIEERER